jgi:hypothetical protein
MKHETLEKRIHATSLTPPLCGRSCRQPYRFHEGRLDWKYAIRSRGHLGPLPRHTEREVHHPDNPTQCIYYIDVSEKNIPEKPLLCRNYVIVTLHAAQSEPRSNAIHQS